MLKVLILFAIQALVLCNWVGKYTVLSATSVGFDQCDLPPLSSTVTISPSPDGNLTFTRFSTVLNMSITQPLDWSDSQTSGSACYPTLGYCINGNLTSTQATLYWYPPSSEATGCQLVLTPILPSWLGQWEVISSHAMEYCPVPGINSQANITNGVIGLTMTGIDSSTLKTRDWTLYWTPDQLVVNKTCRNYLCATANLTSSGDTLTASISWSYDTLYKCSVVMTQSQTTIDDELDSLLLSF